MDRTKRGLGSLIPEGDWEIPEGPRLELEISQLETNPYQPRVSLDSEAMQELTASVRSHGVLQPLLVRKNERGFELIAGHRRLAAAQAAGLERVPVVIRDCTDRQLLELALVENLQREDINAMDRARAYQKLKDEFQLGQEEISQAVGKSRASVANSLRLLNLPRRVQGAVEEGRITEGHARALMALEDSEDIIRAADEVAKKGLSVRATEKLVKRLARRPLIPEDPKAPAKDPNLADLESRLAIRLGTRVQVRPGKTEAAKGSLHIEYYGLEDLNRICGDLLGE